MEQWIRKLKACKKDQILILLLFGALLLIIALPSGDGLGTDDSEENLPQTEEDASFGDGIEGALEQRLSEILSRVDGIGRTQVMITLKSDGQKVVEKDTQESENRQAKGEEGETSSVQGTYEETTVYEKDAQGNETPFVSEELASGIQGVLVIAQGADDSVRVKEITEAVMALFGIEAHKIKVMKME